MPHLVATPRVAKDPGLFLLRVQPFQLLRRTVLTTPTTPQLYYRWAFLFEVPLSFRWHSLWEHHVGIQEWRLRLLPRKEVSCRRLVCASNDPTSLPRSRDHKIRHAPFGPALQSENQ